MRWIDLKFIYFIIYKRKIEKYQILTIIMNDNQNYLFDKIIWWDLNGVMKMIKY